MAMTMEVSVRMEVQTLARRLSSVQRDQLPFATAVALTRTAQAVQNRGRELASRTLGFRRSSAEKHVLRGIRIQPARKNDPTALVFSIDPFMAKQAEPGVYRGQDYLRGRLGAFLSPRGARGVAGPGTTGNVARLLRRPLAAVPVGDRARRARSPRKFLEKTPNAVVLPLRSGRGFLIAERTGRRRRGRRGRSTGARDPRLRPQYILTERVRMQQRRWDLPRVARETVREVFSRELARALDEALATARR